jgi:hypothetical protein
MKLQAAHRLLAEENPQEESLKRRLETQKEKEDPTSIDKKAIIDTEDQLKRTKEQSKRSKALKELNETHE